MPVHNGRDSKGSFYQWGKQAKYYYVVGNTRSRNAAKRKASLQRAAIKRR